MLVAGIDLGKLGAIGVVNTDDMTVHAVWAMPLIPTMTGAKKNRTEIDVRPLFQMLQTLADIGVVLVTCEAPGYRPGQSGAGTVGLGWGYIRMGCHVTDPGLRLEKVQANAWKAGMKVPTVKDAATKYAANMFPAAQGQFYGPRGGVLDGKAEAVLIAVFGARRFLGIRK